jgi:hemoglobin
MPTADVDRRELDGSIEWDDLHPHTRRLLSRRRFLTRSTQAVTVFGAMTVVLAACGDDDDVVAGDSTATSGVAAGSLSTRLGGHAAISAVITDFVDNQVVPDGRINRFFANTDLERLKVLLTEFTDMATGGPEPYTGRDMATSHAGLAITVADFNALVEDLTASLDVFAVPDQEQSELLAALAPLQSDIVTA